MIAQCAPTTISHNAKYKLPQPQVNHLSTTFCQDISEEEEAVKDDNTIHDPSVYAARYGKQNTSDSNSSYSAYTPNCCKVCGTTQKECHQRWRTIHDPDDPEKCPFRSPEYIEDKRIRENLLQYNLKHPEKEKGLQHGNKKAPPIFCPPGQPTIPEGKDATHDPSVGKMAGTPSIQSLIEFIDKVDESLDDNLHAPKVTMTHQLDESTSESANKCEAKPSTTDFFPDTSTTIPPSKFYRIQE